MSNGQEEPRRVDASMTLLRETMERPLDPGYAAAARRRESGARRPKWWHRVLVLLLAALLGLVSVWAARELRAPSQDAGAARSLLQEQIRQRSAHGEAQQATNEELAADISELQEIALDTDDELLAEVRRLGAAAGSTRVVGEGLVITLDDSRDAQAGLPDAEMGRVQDLDLQVLANSLWSSGAEAIAINGHRLSSLSAIRSAGQAVLVDLAPLQRPYEVTAIGDAEEMQSELARSSGGAHLTTLEESFSISVTMSTEEELELPGGPSRTLRYAEVLDDATTPPEPDPDVDAPTDPSSPQRETGTGGGD